MSGVDLQPVLARLKKRPLLEEGAGARVAHGRAEIERLLPHRDPMLLVDAITHVDLAGERLAARRRIDPGDPVLGGHFPGEPIYPGALLTEAMGQAALCLLCFVEDQTLEVSASTRPKSVRLTRIHHAAFLAPVRPGDEVRLLAQCLERDLTALAASQAWVGSVLAAYCVTEVYIDE